MAGRNKKPEDQKKKQRPVYASDVEWKEIEGLAAKDKMETSPYVVKKALNA